MRTLLLAAFAVISSHAQIAVSTLNSAGAETAVEGLVDAGTVAAGDMLDTRFRLRNTGASNVTLQILRIAGPGFSIQGDPSKPYQMAAGTNVDFRVRFLPPAYGTYSATLTVNDKTYFVLGTSPRGATIETAEGAVLQSDTLVQFGRVEVGQSVTRRFLLRNESPSTITVRAITVSPASFAGPLGIALPVEIAVGDVVPFEVRFAPVRSGVPTGKLTVDERVFTLEGVALDPPFPEAQLLVDSAALESGVQGRIEVKLAAPSPVTGVGTLTLTFQPKVAGVEDAAIQFLANGKRQLTIHVAKGEDIARVSGQAEIFFQTGSTAGDLTIQLDLGFQTVRAPIALAELSVRLDSTRAERTSTGVELTIEGFDNTRTVTHVLFTFYDRGGQPLAGHPLRMNVTNAFTGWWRQSNLGGVFLLNAAFPVAGDATQLTGVMVEFENSAGKAASPKVSF